MAEGVFQKAIKNGQFVVTAECTPPRGADAAPAQGVRGRARRRGECDLRARERGRRRGFRSLAACRHLAAAGAEPVLHLLTRDLNRIALQSTILGAASMGVKNVLCLSGRHQALTSSSSARGVFDVDPIQLLQVADAMRKDGKLADGQRSTPRSSWCSGPTPTRSPIRWSCR